MKGNRVQGRGEEKAMRGGGRGGKVKLKYNEKESLWREDLNKHR